jgi:hypothetical protein
MGIADPSGFNFLTNLMNKVGGTAQNQLGMKKPTGYNALNKTFGALQDAPPTVLPGGGTLDQGIQSQTAMEEMPAASLPLFQGQRQYDIGLSGAEAGATNLGAQTENLGTQFRSAISGQLAEFLKSLGIGSSSAIGGGGSADLIMKLLAGAF